MWITHSYLGTNKNGVRCLFFLLFKDYIEAEKDFSTALTHELERFARNMGNFCAVVQPFSGDAEVTRKHILDKNWTDKQREMAEDTPSLLVIDQDFNDFDPSIHSWCLIRLGKH